MLEGLVSAENINYAMVFSEGILSFFSPCVLPIVPVYCSYLAGNTKKKGEDGNIHYDRKTVLWHTLFFVLGISMTFFILGFSFTALGRFLGQNKMLLTRIAGVIVVFMGLIQLGIFNVAFAKRELKLPFQINPLKMNAFTAFLMGFVFSFAWTPCIGPALSSVLLLVSSAKDIFTGVMLMILYALGFVLPFLALGLFTTQILRFLDRHQNALKYTIKVGGVILVLIGIMMFTGWMNGVSGYISSATTDKNMKTQQESKEKPKNAAVNFELTDQYGKTHQLSDYKGKVVFINFWASWCSPCKSELPDIEKIYRKYGKNTGDIIILTVTNPKSDHYPNNEDMPIPKLHAFLQSGGYTFPTLFDETSKVFNGYGIVSFPTTFLVGRDGNIEGYVTGALNEQMIINAIEMVRNQSENK